MTHRDTSCSVRVFRKDCDKNVCIATLVTFITCTLKQQDQALQHCWPAFRRCCFFLLCYIFILYFLLAAVIVIIPLLYELAKGRDQRYIMLRLREFLLLIYLIMHLFSYLLMLNPFTTLYWVQRYHHRKRTNETNLGIHAQQGIATVAFA